MMSPRPLLQRLGPWDFAAIALALAFVAVFVVRQQQHAPSDRAPLEAALDAIVLTGPSPDVVLRERDETPRPLSDYRGRVVFVNFWATWCGPCVAEMPSLIALANSLDPADIAFVSIAEDDTWAPLDTFLRRTPLPFDVFRDRPPRVEEAFQTNSYPTSFLIDRRGQIRYRFQGGRDWNTPEVRALLELEGVHSRP